MSARIEWELLELRRRGVVAYQPGGASVEVLVDPPAHTMEPGLSETLARIDSFVTETGGTGVHHVLYEAVRRCAPLLLYPSDDIRQPSSLRMCLVMKRSATAEDAFRAFARLHHSHVESKKEQRTSSASAGDTSDKAAAKYKFVRFESRVIAVQRSGQLEVGPVIVCRKDDPILSAVAGCSAYSPQAPLTSSLAVASSPLTSSLAVASSFLATTQHALIRVHMNMRQL